MSQDLGFGQIKQTLATAAAFKPKPIVDPDPPPSVVRQMTDQADVIPQAPQRIVRKRTPKGLTQPLNMRLEVDSYNRFVNLSINKNMTYAETMEFLLDSANV